jgi:hypothetical protein
MVKWYFLLFLWVDFVLFFISLSMDKISESKRILIELKSQTLVLKIVIEETLDVDCST